MFGYRPAPWRGTETLTLGESFGVRGLGQLRRDYAVVIRDALRGERFQVDRTSVGLLRPELSIPAYLGWVPNDGLAPIFNLFDRHGGGRGYSQRVSRRSMRDFRGGRLSYDEHDGTDFVCPVGTPLSAAASGRVAMIRDNWLRGGLTVAVDHGGGVLTQYTHCSRALKGVGESVLRGEVLSLSGAAGMDMTQFFPWVPPHLHFMVWVAGRPVDPFIDDGESYSRVGTWARPNEPKPFEGTAEMVPEWSEVDGCALREVIQTCTSAELQAELYRGLELGGAVAAALAEDALHHDRWAWPRGWETPSIRPTDRAEVEISLALPLPPEGYRGVRFADR